MHAANEVIMPVLGMIQDSGKIVQWLIKEGQPVKKGQPLLEVETDKAVVEIEAPVDGFLRNIQAQAGDEVPVGQIIAVIMPTEDAVSTVSTPSEAAEAPVKAAQPVSASPLAARMAAEHHLDLALIRPQGGRVEKDDVLAYLQAHASPVATDKPVGTGAPRPLASPKARRLAAEKGLDISKISGSGPQGAVLEADLSRLAASVKPAIAENVGAMPVSTSQDIPISTNWRVMAEHTTQAWTTTPHFFLTRDVDVSNLIGWHEHLQAKSPKQFSITDLLVKLVAAALKRHPRVNAYWKDGHLQQFSDINIGLAVAFEDGLAVPVIPRADQIGLADIAARRKDIIERTQQGKLKPDDIQAGTFTISNLGMYGVDAFNAVLNSPQAALLAVGRIAERVVAVNGQPVVRPMMTVTLTCDHRVVDGARGAEFLRTLALLIEQPLGMLE